MKQRWFLCLPHSRQYLMLARMPVAPPVVQTVSKGFPPEGRYSRLPLLESLALAMSIRYSGASTAVTNGDLSPRIVLVHRQFHLPPTDVSRVVIRDDPDTLKAILGQLLDTELEIVSVPFSLVLEEYCGLKCSHI